MKIILYIILIFIIIFFWIKLFEPRFIYYPQRNFEALPQDFELQPEEVIFKTNDNLKLYGWFFPACKEGLTLLYFNGNAGNISNRLSMAEFFNGIGMNVFLFDYRGYGISEGKPSEKGLYRDGQAALEYLKNRKIPLNKIIFFGESIGAAVAIELAIKENCASVITIGAFTNAKEMSKTIFKFLPFHLFISSKFDNLAKIGKISSPILIIHGSKDEIVPFNHSLKLFEKANEPKYSYTVQNAHHNDIFNTGGNNLKRVLQEFVLKVGG